MYDDIHVKVIKSVINYITTPVAHICNRSFFTGKFPKHFKIAKVIPIYKKG